MTGSICPRAPAEANNPQGVVQSIGCLQCAVIKEDMLFQCAREILQAGIWEDHSPDQAQYDGSIKYEIIKASFVQIPQALAGLR